MSGGLGAPVAEREGHHPAQVEGQQAAARVERRDGQVREDAHGRLEIGIRHGRQPGEALDGAAAQEGPDLGVGGLHLLLGGAGRQGHADALQALEEARHGGVHLSGGQVERALEAGGRGQLRRGERAGAQLFHEPARLGRAPRHELAAACSSRSLNASVCSVSQGSPGIREKAAEKEPTAECHAVETWALAPASALSRASRGALRDPHELRAGVQLAHHVEEALAQLVGREAGQQQAADPQVDSLALLLGDQIVRGLLDPVMEEAVVLGPAAAPPPRGAPVRAALQLTRREAPQQPQVGGGEGVAHARREAQQLLGGSGSWRAGPR